MTSTMVTFALAVGGTSLICYALMTRLQNRVQSQIIPVTAPEPVAPITAAETAGAFPAGSVVTIPHWIVRAIRSTRAEATGGEAAMAVRRRREVEWGGDGAGAVISAAGCAEF